jgi:AcrR family transcriptional regulator
MAATRERILEATSVAIAQRGVRKVSLSEIALLAGVSRPTLYKYFASKDDLLTAVAEHEKARFDREFANALHDLTGQARLERALRFMVSFQHDYAMRGLVVLEPGFIIKQLEQSLRTMTAGLKPLFDELAPELGGEPRSSIDRTDAVVRLALSHFLIEGDDNQLLRELRLVSGLI